MKQIRISIFNILSHPLIQILSFSFILVGSPYFGGPYLFFVWGSSFEGYIYGILGMTGIVLTLISLKRSMSGYMQVVGLLFMLASLGVFFLSSKDGMNAQALRELLPLLTLFLFVVVCLYVICKNLLWRNY